MPVQMRYDIAEAGEIDFVGLLNISQRLFYRHHHLEKMLLFDSRQIAHFAYMPMPDHATIARVGNPFGAIDQGHTA